MSARLPTDKQTTTSGSPCGRSRSLIVTLGMKRKHDEAFVLPPSIPYETVAKIDKPNATSSQLKLLKGKTFLGSETPNIQQGLMHLFEALKSYGYKPELRRRKHSIPKDHDRWAVVFSVSYSTASVVIAKYASVFALPWVTPTSECKRSMRDNRHLLLEPDSGLI